MSGFWNSGSFSGSFSSPGSGGPGAGITLPPVIPTALIPKGQLLFAEDRAVEDYEGNTVRLKRLSDNAEEDFGFLSGGTFDRAAVNTWRAGANVDLVKRYDQMGSGKELVAVGSVPFIRSDAYTCFGDAWDPDTGILTLSATNGAAGARIESGGYMTLATSGITTASGLEIHCVFAPFTRKIANNISEPSELNGNSTPEHVIYYGAAGNFFQYIIGNGANSNYVQRDGSGASGDSQTANTSSTIKANSLTVASILCDDTDISFYDGNARRANRVATSTGNQTANDTMTNGTLRIGASLTGTNPGNFLLGPVVVTETLTDLERFDLHCALGVVAHQHLLMTDAELYTLLGGADAAIIDWSRYSDETTGDLPERHGHFEINWNSGTVGGETPALDFAATVPIWGLQGVQSIGESNWANAFMASNNWGADQSKFSCINIGYRNAGGHLAFWWSDGDPATYPMTSSGTNDKWSKGQGFHHNQPCFYGRIDESVDTTNFTQSLPWGDDVGGQLGQAIGKYSLGLPNGSIDNRETVAIIGITNANPAVVTCPTHGRGNGEKTITGITQANPAVVTCVGHQLLTGHKIWIDSVAGMTQVNGAHYVITKLTDNTFSLDSTDSTGWSAYSSGGKVKKTRVYISGVAGMTEVNNAAYSITWIDANSFSLNGVDSSGYGTYTSGGVIRYTCLLGYTFNGHTYAQDEPVDWDLLLAWINTIPTTPENRLYHNWTAKYPFDDSYLEIQIGTTDPNSTYDPENPVVADMRTATRWNYVAPLFGRSFGHLDQSIANQTGTGSVTQPYPLARIQSHPYLNMPDAYRILTIITPDKIFTLDEARKIRLNLPRMLRNGWGDTAPAIVSATISGNERVDETLTCNVTVTGIPTPNITYQWKRDTAGDLNFVNIDGETGQTHLNLSADKDDKLCCDVVVTSVAGTDSASTDPTGIIGASTAPPSFLSNPVLSVVSGNPVREDEMVSVTDGTVIGADPITLAYQYQIADDEAFTTGVTDVGIDDNDYTVGVYEDKHVRCEITATNAYGSDVAYSNVLGPILPGLNIPAADFRWKFDDDFTSPNVTAAAATGGQAITFGVSPNHAAQNYAAYAKTANNGWSTPANIAGLTRRQTFTVGVWFKLTATPSILAPFLNLCRNDSSTAANRAWKIEINNGATAVSFKISNGTSEDATGAVITLGASMGTTNKYLLLADYTDGTDGACVTNLRFAAEGAGSFSTAQITDAKRMEDDATNKLADRLVATGATACDVKIYDLAVWSGHVLTSQEGLDMLAAGSESTAY